MDAYIALYPVMAFVLVVVIGRMGTIILDTIRTNKTTADTDDHHEFYTPHH